MHQQDLTKTVTVQKFVIPGWLLVSIAGVLLVYAIVGELAGFHLIILRGPEAKAVTHRLMECAFLWTVCCSGIGWAIHLRRTRPCHQGRFWPITSVPALAVVWAAAIELVQDFSGNRFPTGMPMWFYWVPPALQIGAGCIFVALLWWQCKTWKRWGATGICPVCRYDLTGNQSGRCPECGTYIESDPRTLAYFYSRKHRWLPELNSFETAGERQTAHRRAIKQEQRTVRGWLGLPLAFVPALCFHPAIETWLGKLWGGTLGASIALAIVLIADNRRRLRARLRQQLGTQRPTTD